MSGWAAASSLENTTARLIFRTVDGKLVKTYGAINPWAQAILAKIDQDIPGRRLG